MAVDKFEVGKWYMFVGDKDLLTREAIDIADGNPKKCINVGKDPKEYAVFEGMKNPYAYSGNMWIWNRKSFMEVNSPIKSKPKNKYRSFTEDDIGKVFTVRQWDDMADEFGINAHGNINTPILFHPHMREFCGNKIKAAMVYIQEVKIVGTFNSFCPQMFEECIIKEPKAGDTAGITREGLKIMTASALKESIEKDMKALSYSFSTPSILKTNWLKSDWTTGFYNNPRNWDHYGASKEFVESLNQQWGEPYFKIEGHDLSNFDKQDKTKSIYYSTPSSNPWYEKFKNSDNKVTPRYDWHTDLGASKELGDDIVNPRFDYDLDAMKRMLGKPLNITDLHKILKEGKISFCDEILPIQRHDLSIKSDKTKFNTDLIKTEKLNFRMDR